MSRMVRMTMEEILRDRAASDKRLKALADLPDEEIDFSDIPELTEKFWQNARPMHEVIAELRTRQAEPVTLKLDRDVLQWLKKDDASQVDARANALLRDAMEHEALKRSA